MLPRKPVQIEDIVPADFTELETLTSEEEEHAFLYVALLMQIKQQSRLNKTGEHFNCFVVNDDSRGTIFGSTLDKFLEKVKNNLGQFPKDYHCELAVFNKHSKHWYSIDCYIHNNTLNTFTLDSMCDEPSLTHALDLIKKYFPKGEHFYFFDHDQKQNTETGRIQYAMDCHILMIDQINRLSKISPANLFATLDQISDASLLHEGASYITLEDMKKTGADVLTPLLRGMQSLKNIDRLPENIKNTQVSTSKNLTLNDYVKKNTEIKEYKDKKNESISKSQNLMTQKKTIKYVKKLNKVLASNELFAEASIGLQDISGFGFLSLLSLAKLLPLLEQQNKNSLMQIIDSVIDYLNKNALIVKKDLVFGWNYEVKLEETPKTITLLKQLKLISTDENSKIVANKFIAILRSLGAYLEKENHKTIIKELNLLLTTIEKKLMQKENKVHDSAVSKLGIFAPSSTNTTVDIEKDIPKVKPSSGV